jgi:hypothetical protein
MTAASGAIIYCSNKEGGFVMEKFNTLLDAAEFAATRCKSWRFATADEVYDVKSLLVLAEVIGWATMTTSIIKTAIAKRLLSSLTDDKSAASPIIAPSVNRKTRRIFPFDFSDRILYNTTGLSQKQGE